MKTTDLILLHLKSAGAHSAKMLAEKLSMTTMGIRQHMQQLEKYQLVSYEDIRTKVGRPTRYWSLTDEGNKRFPNNHHILTTMLLESSKESFGEEGLERLILCYENKLFNRYNLVIKQADSLEEKLQALAHAKDEDGFMAELTKTEQGYFIFVENHCPINTAAHACPLLCHAEERLLRRLIGNKHYIKRTTHIISGERHCTYTIIPLEKLADV